MKSLFTVLFAICAFQLSYAQLNFTAISNVEYNTGLNDIWGYAAPDGTEYALVGLDNGVSIVSLADPENPVEVAMVPGQNSFWRDIKTWGDYAYVTADESGTTDGLLVIDLTNLPTSVEAFNWNPSLPDGTTLNTCHNLWIDENGVCYLSGCGSSNAGGLIFIDVFSEPGNPSLIGFGNAEYSHDVYVRDNLAYSCEINQGQFAVYDVNDLENPILEATEFTPFLTTHNAWLSDDGLTLFTTDEVGNAPVTSYDVSDLEDIKLLDEFVPLATENQDISPHNVHVWDDFLIISYYRDGCILVDAAHPDNLIEVGNFDTFITAGQTFEGAWGAYPYLPSGLVLVSDISNGLYVLEPNYVRACYLEGKVTNANNGNPIFDAEIDFVDDVTYTNTNLTGDYKTGIATPGTYEIQISKLMFAPATATVILENGELTILDVELVPLTPFEMTGTVVDVTTGEAIEDALVQATIQDFNLNTTTDENGNYSFTAFEGEWEIIAGKWGFSTAINADQLFDENNTAVENLELTEGYEDVFSLELGWEIIAAAPQGNFERAQPIGIPIPGLGFDIQPDEDVEDIGGHCYLTGASDNLFASFLAGGTTSIISPEMDLSDMNEPKISYYTWIYGLFPPDNQGNLFVGDDRLLVKITNGTDTVTVDIITPNNFFFAPTWNEAIIDVKSNIEVSETMKVIFETEQNTAGDLTEVAIDYFQTWDADPNSTREQLSKNVIFEISPNPNDGNFLINYDLGEKANNPNLLIYNALGQKVKEFPLNDLKGSLQVKNELGKGIYLTQIRNNGEVSFAKKLIVE